MRLQRIAIHNFRVLKHTELTFSDDVMGIIGPNGAGKSSIVEAIAWALYGKPMARSSKDEIKSAAAAAGDNCEVHLSFEIAGSSYEVIRRLVGKSGRPEVQLYRDGAQTSVGSTETGGELVSLLGLDWRGFLTSFLARQQELNTLSDLAPHKRRDHLAGMLGIQRLDKAIDAAKGDSKLFGRQAEMISGQLADFESLRGRTELLTEELVGLKHRREVLSGALTQATGELKKSETEYREHQQLKDKCSQLQASVQATRQTAEHIREHVASQQVTMGVMTADRERLAPMEQELRRLDPAKADLKKMSESRVQARRRVELSAELERMVAEQKELQTKLSVVDQELGSLKTTIVQVPDNLEERLKVANTDLATARNDWSECKASLEVCRKEIERLRRQLTSLDDIGAETVCERCHRPFGNDLPEIRKHLESELQPMIEEQTQATVNLELATVRGQELKQTAGELEQQKQHLRDLKAKEKTARERQADLAERNEKLRARQTDLKQQCDAAGGLDFNAETFESLLAEVTHLEKQEKLAAELRGRVANLESSREEIARSQEKLKATDSELAELNRQVSELGFDHERLEKARLGFEKTRVNHEASREAHQGTAKEFEIKEREQTVLLEQLGKLATVADQLEVARSSQYYAEKLSTLFTDFRKIQISQIRPRLADLAGDLISEMTDGRYSLLELDKDYNLRLWDGGLFYGIERFSGGEKDLANLCLRLAISLALTESAGLDRSFIILDEVFGSQDESRRDLIFDALAHLKNRFPQILLITHIEDLKHKVETLVEVRPTPSGWSEVIVNGQTT